MKGFLFPEWPWQNYVIVIQCAVNPVSCLSGAVHGEPDASAEIGDTLEGKQEVDGV